MNRKEPFRSLCRDWGISLAVMVVLTMACNMAGYGGHFLESIPGMLILCIISFLGLTAKHFIPVSYTHLDVYKRQHISAVFLKSIYI